MKLSDIAINPEKLEKGDWVDNIPECGELRLKVRGIGNSNFKRMQTKLFEAEPRKYKTGGKLDPERAEGIQAKCLLHTVLLDWDGMLDENDQPIPYSKELAEELLTNPAYRRFRDGVIWAASVVADDDAEEVEEVGKNSKKPSSGS